MKKFFGFCGVSRVADGHISNCSDAPVPRVKKSLSLSQECSPTATEFARATRRSSMLNRTQASDSRRKHATDRRPSHPHAGLHRPHSRTSIGGKHRQHACERRPTNSAAPSTNTKAVSLQTASEEVSDNETPALLPPSETRCPPRARRAVRRETGEDGVEGSAVHRPKKHSHTKRRDLERRKADAPAKARDSSSSLESSQAISPLELTAPPDPLLYTDRGQQCSAPFKAGTENATSTVMAAALGSGAKGNTAHSETKGVTKLATTQQATTTTPPPVSPASRAPTSALSGLNSTGGSNQLSPGWVATDHLITPAVDDQLGESTNLEEMMQYNIEYSDGYAMFLVESACRSKSETSASVAAACEEPPSPSCTPLKNVQSFSRRNRRGSFVSFHGEIRLT
ncbi:hypothetical protein ABL78_5879 [Leptomonas seymouri]|uniref:Uncharacterized protein n=1 Tax=Leptomonas seymouri TaxID=5684 RepID=A0A0N1HW88_LEPSE|nr:hypothetical protein ABL78_5879 [Leptomonas seymouri]|eukprot:KPI85074.1 hypothetical protein ABL78_5879 [Leptomonas seymouri]